MSSDFANRIAPPPRRVPLRLRCALLANLPVMFGGVFLAVGLLFAIVFLSAGSLFGDLRLRVGSREAAGVLTGVERTQFTEGGQSRQGGSPTERERRQTDEHHRIYRLEYSFELPDGTAVQGGSYVKGMGRVRRIERTGEVTVEYVTASPQTNRIQGTRTSPYGPVILLVLIFPAIGLAVTGAGVASAARKVRLLRHGEPALATITDCRGMPQGKHAKAATWTPFEQFRAEMQKPMSDYIEQGTATRKSELSINGIVLWRKAEEVSGAEFKKGFQSHIKLFRGGLCVLFGFWALVFAFMLFAITQAEMSGFDRVLFLGVFLLFASFFSAFGWFVWKWTRRVQGVVSGEVDMTMEDLRVRAECRFEFTTTDGQVVQAEDEVLFDSSRLGDEPHEAVLYDRADPKQALLLDGLAVPVRAGWGGELEATNTSGRVLRLAGVCLVLVAAVTVGCVMAGMMG